MRLSPLLLLGNSVDFHRFNFSSKLLILAKHEMIFLLFITSILTVLHLSLVFYNFNINTSNSVYWQLLRNAGVVQVSTFGITIWMVMCLNIIKFHMHRFILLALQKYFYIFANNTCYLSALRIRSATICIQIETSG